jgi:hypothetical protein
MPWWRLKAAAKENSDAYPRERATAVRTWSVGDEVIGWVDTRASHAELVAV